jgi:hypothetical protein
MRSKETSHVVRFSNGPLGPWGNELDGMRRDRGSILTAPPFGYSPELPLRRPGGPKARPALSAAPLLAKLPPGISRSLRRLRGLRQRLSLCRVTLAAGCDGRLAAIEDRSLIAELAEDGALVVIFIHPPGIGDEEAFSGVLTRLEQALRQSGVPLPAVRVAVVHCDAAAVDEGDATRDLLVGAPSRPLSASSALARALPA